MLNQLVQYLDNGTTRLVEVAVPKARSHQIVVETRASVISPGTERMLVEFGLSSWIGKARRHPDRLRQVLDKARTDGISATVDAVRAKLAKPIPLGYSQAGIVVDIGRHVTAFGIGDRVATNGPHSEYVQVPTRLAARIPDSVPFEAAAFTPLASIALEGIRLAAPTLGETVVVYGLGLIGLLTVQLLQANGCRVIGIDPNPDRRNLAALLGAIVIDSSSDRLADHVLAETAGLGADAVLLTLSSTSNEPVHRAAEMCRVRGRIVLVGVTGLRLRRDEFFRKELSFCVSHSYGPGRGDPGYEEAGNDYPFGFVRWTEQRNFDAVLELMRTGRLDPIPLITDRVPFENAPDAYDLITRGDALGVVLNYRERDEPARRECTIAYNATPRQSGGKAVAGVIGAGNFAIRTLLPLFGQAALQPHTIVSSTGTSGTLAARRFGFSRSTTDPAVVLGDPAIDNVFVLTRHESHAQFAIQALLAGKHVFVEKPLARTIAELDDTIQAAVVAGKMLMVGYNRRFAPLASALRDAAADRVGPVNLVMIVNAGSLPREHWMNDPTQGGRVLGEATHFVDLARYLVRSPLIAGSITTARDRQGRPLHDQSHINLVFEDGSAAAVHYLANGAAAFPKETIHAFFDGRTFSIENWRRLLRAGRSMLPQRRHKPDKGHALELAAWAAAIRRGGPSPIPLDEIAEVTRWSILLAEQARAGAR